MAAAQANDERTPYASVNLASYNLHCPSAAVWSPDNTQIAVLAQLSACTNSDTGIVEPNVIALFNTQGKLERSSLPRHSDVGQECPNDRTANADF